MRKRFLMGWGLAWGLAAVVVTAAADSSSGGNASATVYADPATPLLSETVRHWLIYVGCAAAAAVGSYVALTATEVTGRTRRLVALCWAAIAAATVWANFYLGDHPGPDWWYRTITISGAGPVSVTQHTRFTNPWVEHLLLTLMVAGAAGGLIQSLANRTRPTARRAADAIAAMILWASAFVAGRYIGVAAVYLAGGATIDAFEAAGISSHALALIGPFIGGFLTGTLVGAIASLSPGIRWRT